MGGPQQPKIGLNLKVAQKQILTPSLVQMVSVLVLNKLELREMINQEITANPVLEELPEDVPTIEEVARKAEAERPVEAASTDQTPARNHDSFEEIDFGSFFQDYLDPGYKSPAAEVVEKPSFENFLSQPVSLADHLSWQLSLTLCSDGVREAGTSVIGNLNEDGYLMATLEEIAQSGGHRLEDAQEALRLVQEFDPVGVAARDLRECLLIQLRTLAPESHLTAQLLSPCENCKGTGQITKEGRSTRCGHCDGTGDYMRRLQNKQYREMARVLDRPVKAVERAVELIRKLDPRPGQRYQNNQTRLIEPDLAIVKAGDGYQVVMNEEGLPQLRLSHHYRRMLREDGTSREVRNYVKERFASAIQLIKNIEQRKQTIVKVCEAIIRRQKEFLERGIEALRPMMIKEVAEEVSVHPSTVSRAVANKYAHTPQGVYELRFFFTEAVQGPSGASTSLVNLKRLVKKIIGEEDPAHPLTDEQLTQRLRGAGFCVTRRTVAKYREDMRIPSTHQRRVKS